MRVLLNTYPTAFDIPGGGERQLIAYHRYLPRHGVTSTLFDPWNPCLRQHDVVHFFSVMSGSIHFCSYVKNMGLPLVISPNLWVTKDTQHDYPHEEIHQNLALADRIVVNSRAEVQELASVYAVAPDRFRVVYNGVEEQFLEPADPAAFRHEYCVTSPFILNVANIEPRKNQLTFLRALKQFPAIPLVVVGLARDADYFSACRLEGGSQFVHIGPLPYGSPLLRSALAACSAFAMPSTLETPSIAALEAAAQGAKIIITEVGCTKEYFGSDAHYLDPHSEESMVRAVSGALSARPRSALRTRIRNRFTWASAAGALSTCYRELCG